tara:strand:- start:31499 stop:32761 length:1263 start_codon:yes stop_codon:yes gene_type:complete
MFIDLKKTLFLAAAAPLAFGACGGDDDNGTVTPDATVTPIFDASPDDPDAAPNTTFSGTISLAEVAITNEPFVSAGVAGAVVNVSFTDPATVTVPPQPGYENNIGACRIFVYDLAGGDEAPVGADGGRVTIAGTNGTDLPAFACDYNAAVDTYLCASGDSAASGAMAMADTTLAANGNGTVTLTIPGANFSNENYVGMQIILDGFSDPAANGRFGIVAQPANTTLVLANPALLAATTLTADSAYQTLIGAGPVPGGFDFLDDGTNDIVITKDPITNAPAIDATLTVNGEGFALDDASIRPHELPINGDEATFSCGGTGGDCGVANGFLKGIIVFGETTDAPVDPSNPTAMPEPVNQYATFQCSGINAESITLDEGAMALIMGTSPTRIQTSITYANAQSGANNIVLSHGVVGFKDTAVPK